MMQRGQLGFGMMFLAGLIFSVLSGRLPWESGLALAATPAVTGVRIGASAKVPGDPRQEYPRFVRFRPADGQTVTLNPPRFSWPYSPKIVMAGGTMRANMRFTLQIDSSKDFAKPFFEMKDTDCNFFNFIPELKGAKQWFWRVGYRADGGEMSWSDTRSFTLADNAVVWDRSALPQAFDKIGGHPRILVTADSLEKARALKGGNVFSAELHETIVRAAEQAMGEPWFKDFPQTDAETDGGGTRYMNMATELLKIAWARMMTGDAKYTGYKERFLTLASWPAGGKSSPEGIAGNKKWNTHLTDYLGLFYDWCYNELTPDERATVRKCLEWRLNHTLNSYAWMKDGGKKAHYGTIAVSCGSHPYENSMVSIAGALAICDESAVARQALEVWTNYIVGITCGMGEDEAWNEGPGYGNGKMKWLVDALWYLQTTAPSVDLGRNEALSAYCDFFSRVTPLGARHSSFGNRGASESDWTMSRITTMRRVAALRGDGEAMRNWLGTRELLSKRLGRTPQPSVSPWVDYFIPLYASDPAPRDKEQLNKFFPLEGWVTVTSAQPSDPTAQGDAVSMTFACRPRGGYSHAFRSENAFDIHAFGATVAVGGDTTSNQSWFANHTMSHNTILVNGQEQLAAKAADVKFCGRIVAWQEGENYVYWAGDATAAYGPKTGLGRFVRHVVFVDQGWFVIFDDLRMAGGAAPGTFQWLYHVYDAVPYAYDAKAGRLTYAIGNADVTVQHVAGLGDLTMEDLRGGKGMLNPVTGEDLSKSDKWAKGKVAVKIPEPLDGHHFWFSHKTPAMAGRYLAVIVPAKKGTEKPDIRGVSDTAVTVAFAGKETTVSFGPDGGDIVVDTEAVLP